MADKLLLRTWVVFSLLIGVVAAWGQVALEETRPPPPSIPNPPRGGNLLDYFSRNTPHEFWLTCLIMAFGLLALALFLWSMRGIPEKRPEDVSRSFVVITVIIATLVLITAGYSNQQIAPAFGLFGTIVGYMLGRMTGQLTPAKEGDRAAESDDRPGHSAPRVSGERDART